MKTIIAAALLGLCIASNAGTLPSLPLHHYAVVVENIPGKVTVRTCDGNLWEVYAEGLQGCELVKVTFSGDKITDIDPA